MINLDGRYEGVAVTGVIAHALLSRQEVKIRRVVSELDNPSLLKLFTQYYQQPTTNDKLMFSVVENELLTRLNLWGEKFNYQMLHPSDPGYIGSKSEKMNYDNQFERLPENDEDFEE